MPGDAAGRVAALDDERARRRSRRRRRRRSRCRSRSTAVSAGAGAEVREHVVADRAVSVVGRGVAREGDDRGLRVLALASSRALTRDADGVSQFVRVERDRVVASSCRRRGGRAGRVSGSSVLEVDQRDRLLARRRRARGERRSCRRRRGRLASWISRSSSVPVYTPPTAGSLKPSTTSVARVLGASAPLIDLRHEDARRVVVVDRRPRRCARARRRRALVLRDDAVLDRRRRGRPRSAGRPRRRGRRTRGPPARRSSPSASGRRSARARARSRRPRTPFTTLCALERVRRRALAARPVARGRARGVALTVRERRRVHERAVGLLLRRARCRDGHVDGARSAPIARYTV